MILPQACSIIRSRLPFLVSGVQILEQRESQILEQREKDTGIDTS
jgi:hypothetical protein